MPVKTIVPNSLSRDSLRRIQSNSTGVKARIAELGVLYSEESRLLSNYLRKLDGLHTIYPHHLPTQASYRWSTVEPAITNWPRRCVNTDCPQTEHEWSDICFSVRDIIKPPDGYFMVIWDHDNIEGRIHDLIVNDRKALQAHMEGLDLHTLTCCDIFGYEYPPDSSNPHTLCRCDVQSINRNAGTPILGNMDTVDVGIHRCLHCLWRTKYNWQGKDTKQRVMAKNFNHGSKYTESYKFVYKIEGIEKYGISREHLENLAKAYIASKGQAWQTKLSIMAKIKRDRISRTVYGARRLFFTSDAETGRQGFSHMISGTVSHYNNQTLILLEQMFGDSLWTPKSEQSKHWLSHNAHDGDKVFIKADCLPTKDELLSIIQRDIEYEGRSITLTAGVKVYG